MPYKVSKWNYKCLLIYFILFCFSKWNAFYSQTDIYVLHFIPFLITVLKFCVMVSGFIYDLYKLVIRPNDLILWILLTFPSVKKVTLQAKMPQFFFFLARNLLNIKRVQKSKKTISIRDTYSHTETTPLFKFKTKIPISTPHEIHLYQLLSLLEHLLLHYLPLCARTRMKFSLQASIAPLV